jgi:predicted nuclease of predicted toxin-antitoxin system
LKRRDVVIFFIDRSLGKHTIAAALRAAGAKVEVHDDHFPPDAKDQDWLFEVGRKAWIVLTKDKRFQNRILELKAIARSRARVFKLTAGTLQGPEMAVIFVKAMRKMERTALSNSGPFIATVTRNGKVRLVMNASKLIRYS